MPELSEKDIAAINKVLLSDDRVEVIPLKDGVKVVRISRQEIKLK